MNKINIFSIIINQISVMFLLMTLGYFIYKKRLIDEVGTKQITNLLIRIIAPIIMITTFQREFSIEKLKQLFLAFIFSLISMIIGFIIAKIIFKKEQKLEQFATTFSNAGFIGIPLVQAILGSDSIFYLSAYLVCCNLLNWTYGIYLLTGKKESISIKQAFVNPATIGSAVGIILFVFSIRLPEIVLSTLNNLASINTPLAMIVLGIYVAQSELKSVFIDYRIYFSSFISLVVIPIIILFALLLIPEKYNEIKTVILIATSAPVGVSLAIFAEQYGSDYVYGSRIISLSTFMSMLTIPAIIYLSNIIW